MAASEKTPLRKGGSAPPPPPDGSVTIEVEIVSALGLASADTELIGEGKSDPFAKAFWRGEEIFRTQTIDETNDAIWEGEHFDIVVTPGNNDMLLIEVWDADLLKQGDFLGQVILSTKQILKLTQDGKKRFHRNDHNGRPFPLTYKANLTKEEKSLVQGDLTLNFRTKPGALTVSTSHKV